MRRALFVGALIGVALPVAAWAADTQSTVAFATGTIQPLGPRPAPNGDTYLNIEGSNNGPFASYGALRWDLTAVQASFDASFGVGNWVIVGVDLRTTQDNAGFTNSGAAAAYYTADDTTNIKDPNGVQYPLFDPNTGTPDLALTEADPVATYTFLEVGTGTDDIVTLFIAGDGGEAAAMAADIENDSILTIVLVEDPADPNNSAALAQTVAGQGGGSPGDPNAVAPRLFLTAASIGGNLPPNANAGADQGLVDVDESQDELITLDGSGSSDSDGAIVRYLWTEGATTLSDTASDTAMVTLGIGVHTITLEVEDDEGDTDTDTVTITILGNPPAPIADAGAHQDIAQATQNVDESVLLDGSGSTDQAPGTIVSYTWTDAISGLLATSASPTSLVSLGAGLHTIYLDVEDNAGNVSRDVTFVKIVPAGTFARHDFDSNLDAATSQSPAAGSFTSPADAFEIKARNVSATIPFAALDDTASADPNSECAPFAFDNQGVVMCAKQDIFFAAVDLRNPDNTECDAGTASFTFNITGQTDIEILIDMGATGDFEASDPNDPAGPVCDPNLNAANTTPYDKYDWLYSVDGGGEQPLFTSSVDEDAVYTQTFFSGRQVVTADPMSMNGTQLDNIMRTISASIPETGASLTVTLHARGDSGTEAYVFDDIIVRNAPFVATCPGDVDGSGSTNITDLGILLANFGQSVPPNTMGDLDGSGTVNITDLGILLADFGCTP
jgi:hypothetical protein